jgi:hypothetical protein
MMIARLEKIMLECKLGYSSLLKLPVISLTVLENGFIGDITYLEAQQFLTHIQKVLRRGDVDIANFQVLRVDSEMIVAVKGEIPFLYRNIARPPRGHWEMNLPWDVTNFWKEMRSKHRKWIPHIKNKTNALNRAFKGKVIIREFRESERGVAERTVGVGRGSQDTSNRPSQFGGSQDDES